METRWCCIAIVRNDNILGCLFAEYSCYYYYYYYSPQRLRPYGVVAGYFDQLDPHKTAKGPTEKCDGNPVDRIPVL